MVQNPNILPLKKAIKVVRPLEFPTKTSYQKWWEENRPGNLAKDVWKVYALSRRKEWTGNNAGELWSYYLGTEIISNQEKNKGWLSYKEASLACIKAGIKSKNEFDRRARNHTLPKGVPTAPDRAYKDKGWPKGSNETSAWGIFLGTGSIQRGKIEYWSFVKARRFVRKIAIKYNLRNDADWRTFTKSGKLPKEIPRNPQREYGKPPWVSLKDWLGRGVESNKKKSESFLGPEEGVIVIRKLAKEYGINGTKQGFQKEWQKFAKEHHALLAKLHIPSDPLTVWSKERAIKRLSEKK